MFIFVFLLTLITKRIAEFGERLQIIDGVTGRAQITG